MSEPAPVGPIGPGVEIGGFVIEAMVGRGGMGFVYRAHQAKLDRHVALKVIAPEFAHDPDFRARFERESRLAARIQHQNVIPVYDVGESKGVLFIAMRLVDGIDLRTLITQEGRLAPRRAAVIVDQVAQALDEAHSRGLVHRDVKPANILLSSVGTRDHVYLADFGLSRHMQGATSLTHTGAFVGTTDYSAPEQIRGEPVDARTDVYSLGCVLFHALTGTVPFPRENELAKLWAHCHDPPPSISGRDPDVPAGFDPVLLQAMAKVPDDRYASAGELGHAGMAAAEPARASPMRTSPPARQPPARPAVPPAAVLAPLAAPTVGGGPGEPTPPGPRSPPGGSSAGAGSADSPTKTAPSTKRRPRPRVAAALAALALAVLAAVIAVAATGGDDRATIKIGAIYPVYGANAPIVQDILDGEQLGMDYVNKKGSYPGATLPLPPGMGLPHLKGAKLELVRHDLGAQDRCAVKPALLDLVGRRHVVAVVGAYESTLTLQGIAEANALGIPLVNEESSVPSLTQAVQRSGDACGAEPRTPSRWFFRLGPSDVAAAQAFFAVFDQFKPRNAPVRIAILHENNDIFGDGAGAVTRHFAGLDGLRHADIATVTYPSQLSAKPCDPALLTKLKSDVATIQRRKPTAVFVAAYALEAPLIVQTMQALHYTPPLLFAYGAGFVSPRFVGRVRKAECGLPAADPNGIITRTSWAPAMAISHPSLTAIAIEDAFRQRYSRPMTAEAASGFTAILTLSRAIDDAGSTDPERIRQKLQALNLSGNETPMPWDGILFDANGQNSRAAVVVQQIRGDTTSGAVYPPALATTAIR